MTSSEPARLSNAALAMFDDSEIETSQNMDLAWICAIGLAVQAEGAGRAR